MCCGFQDHAKAVSTLQKLNVPYLCTVPLVFQSFEEWQASELGLHPIQVALQVCVCVSRASLAKDTIAELFCFGRGAGE